MAQYRLALLPWRGDRVVDGTGLENQRGATHRGFESLPLRQKEYGTFSKNHEQKYAVVMMIYTICMYLDPIINRETNFYYWVQAVCGWDTYYAEQKTYQYYRDKTQNLTLNQKNALQSIYKILKDAEHPRQILAELYTGEILSKEARHIKNASLSLQAPFSSVWRDELEFLTNRRNDLQELDTSNLREPLANISQFLGSSFNTRTDVTVYLLLNPPFGGSMGHVIRQHDFILLHPAGTESKNTQSTTLSTLIHEYVHLLEFNSGLTEKLFKESYDKYIKPLNVNPPAGYSWKSVYSETIANCFANNITGGYFRPKTFHKPRPTIAEMEDGFNRLIGKNNYTTSHLLSWVALNILPDVEEYLKDHKVIDAQSVAKMSELFLEFIVDKK